MSSSTLSSHPSSSSLSRVTNVVLVTKKPGLPFDDFVAYIEATHVPLMHELLGDTLPTTFRRLYMNPSTPPYIGQYRGVDLIMEMGWEDEAMCGRFMAKLGEEEGKVAKLLQASWPNYCDGRGETVVGVARMCSE